MATKLYFHDAANDLEGTFPTGEQSAQVAEATWTDANTLRKMNGAIGAAQVSTALAISRDTANREEFIRFFCSLPLSGAQTVGGGTATLNVADSQSNANGNFWIDSIDVYVWRPSTGAVVGTVRDAVDLGGTEPTANNSEQVTTFTFTTSAVSAADGDVIICEIWADFTQGMSATYTLTFYYDGTTENTTENAVVSNHASFLDLAETLTFRGKTTTRLAQDAMLLQEVVTQKSPLSPGAGLTDNFNDNSRDTEKWNLDSVIVNLVNPAITVEEVNQQVKITVPANLPAASLRGYSSVGWFNMTGSSVRIEVVQAVEVLADQITALFLGLPPTIYAAIYTDGTGAGTSLFFERTNPVDSVINSFIAYDPALHHHWRIRHEPSNDTFRFETSEDGLTWIQRESFSRGASFDITEVKLEFIAGWTLNPAAVITVSIFDNFNTTASQVFTRRIQDRLLLADLLTATKITPAAGGQVFERLVQDGLLMSDAPRREETHVLRDALVLSEQTAREALRMRSVVDALLLADAASRQAERQIRIADALSLSDAVQAAREFFRRLIEEVLVSDVLTATKISAGGVVERLVQETLLLSDAQRTQADRLRTVTEALALADVVRFAVERLRSLQDALLLSDAQRTQADRPRSLLDTVLLSDVTRQQADRVRQVLDALLLSDVFTAEKLAAGAGQVITRLVQDSLLLSDVYRREMAFTLRERLALADEVAYQAVRLRVLADLVGLLDQAALATVRERLVADALRLDDAIRTLREIHLRDSLLVTDSVTRTFLPSVVELLEGIKVRIIDCFLGIEVRTQDPLGRGLAPARFQDPLGRDVGGGRRP